MQLLVTIGRLVKHDRILPSAELLLTEQPPVFLHLAASSDLHWRRHEWKCAIELAKRALSVEPRDFHTLAILVSSYGILAITSRLIRMRLCYLESNAPIGL